MDQPAIEFRRVVKRYGDTTAVAGIDLQIEQGELVTFLGPSGCGKTTSLRLIAGLELPSSGQMYIAGRDVSHDPASSRNIGMVFQSYALFPHMSVLENVIYGPTLRGLSKRAAIDSARELLDLIGLQGLGDRLPSELSGGQQQRVAVARAIIQQPDVILFDEPLSNVDAKLRRKVRDEIRSLQRRFGLTAVYVTHDQEEALAVSDRIVVMNQGQIEQVGPPSMLYERPKNAFIANFIGDANLISGVIQGGIFKATDVLIPLQDQDGPAVISVRPERIGLLSGGSATILSASYLGSRIEYLVDALIGEVLVSRPIFEPRFEAQDSVTLQFDPTTIIRVG